MVFAQLKVTFKGRPYIPKYLSNQTTMSQFRVCPCIARTQSILDFAQNHLKSSYHEPQHQSYP